MSAIKSLIIAILALTVSLTCTILVMIHGWGLEPKNWWWIVGIYLFGQFVGQTLLAVAKADDDKK